MAPPKQTDPQFKLRMTPEIKEAIEAAASKNNRSMNAEIIARLEESFSDGSDGNDPHFIDPKRALYVLLDANGHPISWQEITTHLNAIATAGKFEPEMIQGMVFNAEIRSNSQREKEWWELYQHYQKSRNEEDDQRG